MTIRIFSRNTASCYVEWKEEDLWKAVENAPVETINIDLAIADVPNIFKKYKDSIADLERAKNADLDYPIIVARQGNTITVLDGFHRIYRARQAHQTEIKVKYLLDAPTPINCVGSPVVIPGLNYEWIKK